MKIFLAQKVSGEDKERLRNESREICKILNELGHEIYCSFLEDKSFDTFSKKEKILYAFEKIDNTDTILIIVRSDDKSVGMLLEIGYAIAKNKKIVLLIHKDKSSDYLESLANQKIEFEDIEDLKDKLKKIK